LEVAPSAAGVTELPKVTKVRAQPKHNSDQWAAEKMVAGRSKWDVWTRNRQAGRCRIRRNEDYVETRKESEVNKELSQYFHKVRSRLITRYSKRGGGHDENSTPHPQFKGYLLEKKKDSGS
jgi:hypothetical protein